MMRGRHSAAILEMMGVTDTIADTLDDYVAIAARLARDRQARSAARQRIAENKDKLYRDRAVISALEDYIERAARHGLSAGKICRIRAESARLPAGSV